MYPMSSLLDMMSLSTIMLIKFHESMMVILIIIMSSVAAFITTIFISKTHARSGPDGQGMEVIWTFMPGLLLLSVAVPSLRVLYMMDSVKEPVLNIKVVGHQWYWSYFYPELVPNTPAPSFDSFMVPEDELNPGEYRLLESTPHLVIPTNNPIAISVTSADVLHSWAVPSLAMKLDAIPGRINNADIVAMYPGIYYGQCSEICGANHSFMPITVEAIPPTKFLEWYSNL